MVLDHKGKMVHNLLLCPSSGIGHLNPMIALAVKLRSAGVGITFVCPDDDSFSFVSTAPEADEFDVVKLFETEAPAVPAKADIGRFLVKKWFKLQVPWPDYSHHQSQFGKMLQSMIEVDNRPVAVVFDACTTWAWIPASKLSIPTFAISALSTFSVALDIYTTCLSEKGGELPSGPFVADVPGLPPFPTPEAQFRIDVLGSSFGHIRKLWDEQILKSDGFIGNSSFEIDGSIVEAMHDGKITEDLAGKVFAVGPLVRKNHREISKEQLELLTWLDDQPPRSVVFITFGSWEGLFEEQVIELAAGLEASGCRFLWMEGYKGEVPTVFRKKMVNQGLVACGFTPQQEILAHPSVGAFLTHCGWNSVVECLTLGGIPMVAWGLILDQTINAHLVAHLGVGVEPLVNGDTIVERKEVERAIRLVMQGETAETFRARAAEIKEKLSSKKAAEASKKQLELLLSKMFNSLGM